MKRSLLLISTLTLLTACEPRTTPANRDGAKAPERTERTERTERPVANLADLKTPPPRGDDELAGALDVFLDACPDPGSFGCDEAPRGVLAGAMKRALDEDVEGALGELALATSRGGARGHAAGSLASMLPGSSAVEAAAADAFGPPADRLIEVWSASKPEASASMAELTARVGLRAGRVEELLDVASRAESADARGELYRWLFVSGDEQVLDALSEVWDARAQPLAARAGAARAPLELEPWPQEVVPRLCTQARNQLEAGDPELARWWVSILWRCDGAERAYALEVANQRLELHTFDLEFARALTSGPCAQTGAGLVELGPCNGVRALLERALQDSHVEGAAKVAALRALARGWPDEGLPPTIARAAKSQDAALREAAAELAR